MRWEKKTTFISSTKWLWGVTVSWHFVAMTWMRRYRSIFCGLVHILKIFFHEEYNAILCKLTLILDLDMIAWYSMGVIWYFPASYWGPEKCMADFIVHHITWIYIWYPHYLCTARWSLWVLFRAPIGKIAISWENWSKTVLVKGYCNLSGSFSFLA